ncbi:MAG TPA: TetR family transcriptional regulator [Chloroflexota bacterium]|nr:TetR family transcriptional regulator [Chloroflexota bacterium]
MRADPADTVSTSQATDPADTTPFAKTARGEQTRMLILETALRLFRERGYEETTMRAIAQEAGVSLGNAYYYFRSKEHLIQAFYARSHEEHLAAAVPLLEREQDLKARLLGVVKAKIETTEPYHRFSGILFKSAADPQSPLSPFSPESNPVRQQSTALMAQVLAGSNVRVPKDLEEELPHLLWLYLMGIVLFWIHDFSPGHRRTYRLIDHTVDLVVRTINLASLPLMRPIRRRVLNLLADLRQDVAPDEPTAGP